jgi:hypothetical protein
MAVFFDIFRKPTIESQAEKYPTLHNAIPNYLHILRMLDVQQLQNDFSILKQAAKAAHKVMADYYKKAMDTRHSTVAVTLDPRYKLDLLAYLHQATGGVNSPTYKKAKSHMQHVFSDYKRRAIALGDFDRQQAADDAIDAQEALDARELKGQIPQERELVEEDDWRVNAFHGWQQHLAARPAPAMHLGDSELERWLREPVLPHTATPEQQRVYMASMIYSFPLICQMARDFRAIPATSAPSERTFSMAGNLISKKRTRICSENLRYVLCLRSWGFLVEDDDEEELQIDDEGRIIRFINHVVVAVDA